MKNPYNGSRDVFCKIRCKRRKRAQLLALVIKDYEERQFKIDAPTL